jgi:dihydrofolate synthase / folylpolyglutamate synthase
MHSARSRHPLNMPPEMPRLSVGESDRYTQALAYLSEFADQERGGVPPSMLGLSRIRSLLEALGNPQSRFPSVLIAGTKGKGSTAAMVERALRAEGYRTGFYSQPHLHTIRERVRLDGQPIVPDDFANAMEAVRHAVEQTCEASGPTTAYEVMTSLALDAFATARVDVAVLEVGLGGRLDATNAVDAVMSAITSISLDHTQILGETVEEIAREKADIIKPRRPCVTAPQPRGAMAVIQQVADARGSPLFVAGAIGAHWDRSAGDWDLVTTRGKLPAPRPALAGSFQRVNVEVAATILDVLHFSGVCEVSLDSIRTGIEKVEWPGRFERVKASNTTVVLDGAHNVDSAQKLRTAIRETYGDVPVVLVLGIAADKDVPGIVAALAPAANVIATRSHNPRAADPEHIAGQARRNGMTAEVAPSVEHALRLATASASPDAVVVVTGSLYVVAEAREALGLAVGENHTVFNPWGSR